jgi:hypothetical protein
VLPSLSVGGLNYTAVGDAGDTSASASPSAERLPATQGVGAGRDVKFLSVFVVSGGIQMPQPANNNSSSTAATNNN